jgi:hypothetical protein
LDTIPKGAAMTLRKHAGGAKIERVSRAHEGGRVVFEAAWFEGGLEREASVTALGMLIELEEEIESSLVPAIVRSTAVARLANATTMKFVKIMPAGTYEVEATIDGREREMVFTADGREIGDDDRRDEDD